MSTPAAVAQRNKGHYKATGGLVVVYAPERKVREAAYVILQPPTKFLDTKKLRTRPQATSRLYQDYSAPGNSIHSTRATTSPNRN